MRLCLRRHILLRFSYRHSRPAQSLHVTQATRQFDHLAADVLALPYIVRLGRSVEYGGNSHHSR